MNAASIVPGILFVVGIGAIFISNGTMMQMLAGDALVALAGLSFVKFSK
jgi:NADH:ubiquinone oxidoreductase subunit K